MALGCRTGEKPALKTNPFHSAMPMVMVTTLTKTATIKTQRPTPVRKKSATASTTTAMASSMKGFKRLFTSTLTMMALGIQNKPKKPVKPPRAMWQTVRIVTTTTKRFIPVHQKPAMA